jgi:hypothetical protein
MSAYLYNFIFLYYVCSTVWCLSTCMMSSYLNDVCWKVWGLPTWIMSAQLYDVCLPYENCSATYVKSSHFTAWWLPTYMKSVQLYNLCSTYCTMSAYLYDFFLHVLVWCLPICMMCFFTCLMSAYLHDDIMTAACIISAYMYCTYTVMSGYLYYMMSCFPYVCLPVWYLATCFVSSYFSANLHYGCSTYKISPYLYDLDYLFYVLLSVHIMSGYLYDVFLLPV